MSDATEPYVFDPHAQTMRQPPAKAEIDRVKLEAFQALSSIGGWNAITVLVPMLGAFCWSENLHPSTPDFDAFIAEVRETLREQIELMGQGPAMMTPPTSTALN
jgi:hypothetical protein